MPYSNAWTDTNPPVGEQAKNIGIDARQLRLDVHERMDSIVQDWTADPIVIQDSIAGNTTGIQILIPFCQFLSDLNAKENDIGADHINGFVGFGSYFAPVRVPVGCTITLVEWLLDLGDASSLTCYLLRRAFVNNPPGGEILATVTHTTVSPAAISPSGTLAIVVDGGHYYHVGVFGNGTAGQRFGVYAVRITCNRPSNDNST